MRYIVFIFLFLNLSAQDDYSFRVAYGRVTKSDFAELLVGDIQKHPNDLRVLAFDGGRLLEENMFDLPLDLYIKVGASRFDEGGYRDDVYEAALYFKLYWNIDLFQNRGRVGFGEGASYTTGILYAEYVEATSNNDNNSKALNYLDFSLDFDVGKVVHYQPLHGTFVGFAFKHRSGVFGLINNVRRGGSNYYTAYLEQNF